MHSYSNGKCGDRNTKHVIHQQFENILTKQMVEGFCNFFFYRQLTFLNTSIFYLSSGIFFRAQPLQSRSKRTRSFLSVPCLASADLKPARGLGRDFVGFRPLYEKPRKAGWRKSTVRGKMAAVHFPKIPCEPNTANRLIESLFFLFVLLCFVLRNSSLY